MNKSVYVLTFATSVDGLIPLDGFNQMLCVTSTFDEAVDFLKEQLEAGEHITDIDLHHGNCDYVYTNLGAYRIEKAGVWFRR